MKVVTVKIKFPIVGPSLLEELQPFGGILVTVVVRAYVGTEHVELVLEPAAHDIERESPVGDVIDGRRHLRHHQWMHQRYVAGGEHGDVFGQRAECCGPGEGLERGTVKIRRSAVAAPAPDRQQRLHAGTVDRLRDIDCIGPIELPGLWHCRDGRAMTAIERHDAELHVIAAKQSRAGGRVAWRCGGIGCGGIHVSSPGPPYYPRSGRTASNRTSNHEPTGGWPGLGHPATGQPRLANQRAQRWRSPSTLRFAAVTSYMVQSPCMV